MNQARGRRMFIFLAAVCLWISPVQADESPRDFTLALSWQPAFCELSGRKPECRGQSAQSWDARHFALHGLWPNIDRNRDGRIDGSDNYCLPEPRRSQVIGRAWRELDVVDLPAAVKRDVDRVMPGTSSWLERHQWTKHGTCAGIDQAAYFQLAIARTDDFAATTLNKLVADGTGGDIARRDFLAAFEADFGRGSAKALRLICDRLGGTVLLSEIRLQLRAETLAQPLSRASLAIPAKAPGGSCPARFRIDAAG